MTNFFSLWNTFNILCFWLFISYCECAQNESQSYPHSFMKCCESNGNSTSSHGGPTGSCGSQGPQFLLLPNRLFPGMSTDFKQVEVKLWNSAEELKCDRGQGYLDISIDISDNETSSLVSVGGKKGFPDVAFSGDNFLAADGNIYDQRQFCVNSRTSNKTHLTIKTCQRPKCSKSTCIPRCCGGDQSILTSPPTFHNESLLKFCSTPTLGNRPWNPWTSDILRVENRTALFQTRYAPQIEGNVRQSDLSVQCRPFSVTLEDEASLTYLEDGRLQVTLKNTTRMLENFCIDGINVGAEENSPQGNRETPEEKLVVYFCAHLLESISLPTCSDLAKPHDQLLQLPPSLFPNMTLEKKDVVAVRLTTGKNNGHLNCPWGHENRILFFSSSKKQFIDNNGGLFLQGVYYTQSEFCIHTLADTLAGLRVCSEEDRTTSGAKSIPKQWWEWLLQIILMLAIMLTLLVNVAIAVVYIRRKDKERVFRWSIAAFCIAMTLTNVIFLIFVFFRIETFPENAIVDIVTCMAFFYMFGLSWMTVLCFDAWRTIKYFRPGSESKKRLWIYVAFTSTLPTVLVGVSLGLWHVIHTSQDFAGEDELWAVLDILLPGSAIGLICLNFLFFFATFVKLFIAQPSSNTNKHKQMLVLYFKLFFLVGLRWILDLLAVLSTQVKLLLPSFVTTVTYFLLFLHPIVLFFFLVWDEENKRFLETNYPRIERALDLICGIGYPVSKCWGLCWRWTEPEDEGASGDGAIEIPLILPSTCAST